MFPIAAYVSSNFRAAFWLHITLVSCGPNNRRSCQGSRSFQNATFFLKHFPQGYSPYHHVVEMTLDREAVQMEMAHRIST